MQQAILYIPILTTVFSAVFATIIFQRYRVKGKGTHLLWWAAGIALYGVGTLTEASVTLFGWREWLFRSWYISGALLGGAPLAQGTVYLLLRRRTANRLTAVLLPVICFGAVAVLLAPLDYSLVEAHRPSGKVIVWTWVRMISPFINIYAFTFLVGGAALSAWRYRKSHSTYHRFIGNVWIAIGAILPGIGGTFTRLGYTEVLYVTELIGLMLIYLGYRYNLREPKTQRKTVEPTMAI